MAKAQALNLAGLQAALASLGMTVVPAGAKSAGGVAVNGKAVKAPTTYTAGAYGTFTGPIGPSIGGRPGKPTFVATGKQGATHRELRASYGPIVHQSLAKALAALSE